MDQFELHASEKVPNTSYSVCQDRKGTCPISRLHRQVDYFWVADDPEANEKTSGAVGQLRGLRRKGVFRLEQFLLIVSGIANEMKFREYGPPEADSFAFGPVHV